MYARDVEDWNGCRAKEKAVHQTRVWGQMQYPVTAEAVHYYKSPGKVIQRTVNLKYRMKKICFTKPENNIDMKYLIYGSVPPRLPE